MGINWIKTIVVIVAMIGGTAPVWAEGDEAIRSAVVKVHTSSASADYFTPWSLLSTSSSTGSGAVISKKRILTNAHVVANSQFIQVQKNGSPRRFKAEVAFISHEADLALLTVAEASFWEGTTVLSIGKLPETLTEVSAYGYPVGGSTLSITKGILSRIENQAYSHSESMFLAGQIDAAINPGNSGGPVISKGKIVGLVMQGASAAAAENLGYMIPPSIIQHFLTDIKDGRYDGFPDLGFRTQKLQNPSMRTYYGLPDDGFGVLVSNVLPGSPSAQKLQKDDVLLAIDGEAVASDKSIVLRKNERTHFHHLIDRYQVGETIQLTISRQGQKKKVSMQAENHSADYLLVKGMLYDEKPTYFIYGGIVFVPLTTNLMARWGKSWKYEAPLNFLALYGKWITEERKDVVVALKVLPDNVNVGYHSWRQWIVTEVNGEKFEDFEDFYKKIKTNKDEFVVFADANGYKMVLNHQQSLESNGRISVNYQVPAIASEDLTKQ